MKVLRNICFSRSTAATRKVKHYSKVIVGIFKDCHFEWQIREESSKHNIVEHLVILFKLIKIITFLIHYYFGYELQDIYMIVVINIIIPQM